MRTFLLTFSGIAIGAAGFGLVRLAALPPPEIIHFHANWAVWIDGERVDFSADRYMEDVAACSSDGHLEIAPENRVHMHANNPDVVHVHHGGATWGHLLQNIGWGIGENWIVPDTGEIYRDTGGAGLTFVLNGFAVPPAHNRAISPGDRLLISFGTEDYAGLMYERFTTVADDAANFDATFDPAACSGHAAESFGDRLRRAFWF
jgi:hypothetical protein